MALLPAPQQVVCVGGSGVWDSWNYVYSVSSTTVGSYYGQDPWPYWNGGYTTSATTVTAIGWPQWQTWNQVYEETAEQQAERERRRAAMLAERQQRADAERARLTRVSSRAEQLLLSLLSDAQRRTYTEHGWFEVRGSKGGRWRIRNSGQAGNVDLMPEIGNEREMSFCCHPPGGLPDADAHVAQMLHLVTDEDGFRRTANIAYRRPAERQRARLVAA